jgi:hypothetical protein
LRKVNLSAASRAVTSFQATGIDTGAPARARVEKAATEVAPRPLRR